MTKLCCFYNDLDPRTKAALELYAPQYGLDVDWVDTSATQQTYAKELEARWDGKEDLILVEQDKEIHALVLPVLLACRAPWCGFTFWCYPEPHTVLALGAFGIVKFSAAVQRMVKVSQFAGPFQKGIDRRFYDMVLGQLGMGICLHGHALHHHVYEPRPLALRQHVAGLRERGILPPAAYPEAAGPHLLPGSYDLSYGTAPPGR